MWSHILLAVLIEHCHVCDDIKSTYHDSYRACIEGRVAREGECYRRALSFSGSLTQQAITGIARYKAAKCGLKLDKLFRWGVPQRFDIERLVDV